MEEQSGESSRTRELHLTPRELGEFERQSYQTEVWYEVVIGIVLLRARMIGDQDHGHTISTLFPSHSRVWILGRRAKNHSTVSVEVRSRQEVEPLLK